jgi:uroporphyrin-3 C-methyltransferase
MDNTPVTEPRTSDSASAPAGSIAQSMAVAGSFWRSPLLLVTLVLGALLLWQWLDNRSKLEDLRLDLAKRLAENDASVRESRMLAKLNQELAASLQARVVTLETGFSAAQSQQLALESMYQELSRTRDERVLAEIEQSITIAAQQLQLAGNVEAALIALNGADARLAKVAQPQFMPLRKLIARDIANLTALPVADISGVALKIESIVAQVDSFPMAFEQRPKTESATAKKASKTTNGKPVKASEPAPAPSPSWWQTLFNDLWSEVYPLIRIERVDHADAGLLPPTQAYFLRENMKLRLVNARLALLARDSRSFREDTRQVAEWLNRYFDTQSHPVQAATTTMKELSTLDIVQQAPSLNETLTAVRNFKLGRK